MNNKGFFVDMLQCLPFATPGNSSLLLALPLSLRLALAALALDLSLQIHLTELSLHWGGPSSALSVHALIVLIPVTLALHLALQVLPLHLLALPLFLSHKPVARRSALARMVEMTRLIHVAKDAC